MTALTRKLFRDLWNMRGQALAIIVVIASGVATFVMSVSTLDALQRSRAQVYAEYRFAEIFAGLKRAPEHVMQRIEAIPGVWIAESRVVAQARMEVEGFSDPVIGRLVSIPDLSEPKLNALYLGKGRRPAPYRAEVLLSEPFAQAHHLEPGATITAIINGRRQKLTVSGVALSPEYIYSLGPGAMFPDNQRYGILWMNREALATAFDMDGAFNDVVLTLTAGAKPDEIIDRLDKILARYGGIGGYQRKDQESHHFLSQEFKGLETMAKLFPVIFLGVAAFLLNVVVTRLVNTEREQIAILKAFGYSNLTVGWHYLQLVLLITSLGVGSGLLLGRRLGQGLGNMYMTFFHFPYLDYRLSVSTMAIAFAISFVAAVIGTLHAVYRAAKLPPAEAMRPEPPIRYRQSLVEKAGIKRYLSQPARMIVRHISRKPVKSLFTVFGIAMAGAIMMLGSFQEDSIDYMLQLQYRKSQREDLTVAFTEPTSRKALYDMASLQGVQYCEPFRSTPIRLHFKHRQRRTFIQALEHRTELHRIMDNRQQALVMPAEGLVVNQFLAKLLEIKVGDRVIVEVLSGHRPTLELPVAATVGDLLGIPVYMNLDSLNRLLDEGDAIDGVFLAVDAKYRNQVYRQLQEMPRVSGITLTDAAVQSARDTLGETILIFTFINTLLASGIAFGVIYNSARIAYAERSRELASLRVLGFSHPEIAFILLGELALLTLAAIPIGLLLGKQLCRIISHEMESDLYRIPLVLESSSYAFAATVVLASAIFSGWIIWQRLKSLDLVAVLKTRE